MQNILNFMHHIVTDDLRVRGALKDKKDPMNAMAGALKNLSLVLKTSDENKDQTNKVSLDSTQILDSLLKHAPTGIAVLEGPDFRYVNINQNLAELNGLSVKDHLGKTLKEVLPDAAENLLPVLRKIMKDGKPVLGREFSITLPKDPAKPVHLIDYLFPIPDKHGKPMGIGAIVLDVTKRKIAESARKESEKKYRLLIVQANDIVYTADRTGHFTFVNPIGLKLTGYSKKKILSMHFNDLVHPEYREKTRKFYSNQIKNNIKNTYYEYPIVTKKGKTVWLGQNVQLLRDSGHTPGIQSVARDISARKELEFALQKVMDELEERVIERTQELHDSNKKLQESEDRYKSYYTKTKAMLYSIDINGEIIAVSNYWLQKFGYIRREVIGKKSVDFLTKESKRYAVDVAFPEFMKRGYANDVSYQFVKKNGEIIDTLLSAVAEYDPKGNFKRSIAVLNDVTERLRAERSLTESREELQGTMDQLKVILDSQPVVTYLSSAEGDYGATYLSNSVLEVTGYRPEEFTSNSTLWADNIHPDDVKRVLSEIPEHFEHGIYEHEYRWKIKNGEYRWFFDSLRLVKTKNGSSTHIVGMWQDITNRKKSEIELLKSKERLKLLMEKMPEGLGVSIRGKIVFSNGENTRMFGYEGEELLNMPVTGFIHPEDRKRASERIKELMEGAEEQPAYYKMIRKDGSVFPAEVHSRTIEYEGESALLSIIRDITKRKEAEEKLEKLKNMIQEENIYLRKEIETEHKFEYIVSKSKAVKQVLRKVEQVAPTDATVLILGETGTGKELLARAVHSISSRKKEMLVKVDCSLLPPNLIQSELFGHERGAFTSAYSEKKGRFELANEGTIFLDEIGDLPLALQSKLLRVLQDGEFERLGSVRTLKLDVRIIAASNRDLKSMVENGEFREDLYYRLNVFPLVMPPLRDHKEDIPLLVRHFIKKYGTKFGHNIKTIPKSSMNRLREYDWPGNVRELENIIERAVIISRGNQLEIGDWLTGNIASTTPSSLSSLADVEMEHIINILKQTNWRVSGKYGAAKILGLKPTTLGARMRKLGIIRKK